MLSVVQQNSPTPARSKLRRLLVPVAALTLVTSLTACNQIPSFDPASQAADRKACDTISSTWNDLSQALASTNPIAVGKALTSVPQKVDQALNVATDSQLILNLRNLKTQADSVMRGAEPDIGALAGVGIGISARCALLGSTANIKLPQF